MRQVFAWCAVSAIFAACGGSQFGTAEDANGGTSLGGSASSGGTSEGGALGKAGKSGKGGTSSGGHAGTTAGSSVVPIGGSPEPEGGTGSGGDVSIGGTPTSGGKGGTAGSGGMSGGGTGGSDPGYTACPVDPPDGTRSCAVDLSCTYGNDLRSVCRSRATCTAHGKWAFSASGCQPLGSCAGIQVGAACDTAVPCALTDSIYCACATCTGPDCKSPKEWDCAGNNSGASCPAVLPNEGQACNVDMTCSYGSCGTGTRITALCKGVIWAWSPEVCH